MPLFFLIEWLGLAVMGVLIISYSLVREDKEAKKKQLEESEKQKEK
jgi:hypothetical protein